MELILEWKRTRSCVSELYGRMICALSLVILVAVICSIVHYQKYTPVATSYTEVDSAIDSVGVKKIDDISDMAKNISGNIPKKLSDAELFSVADSLTEKAVPDATYPVLLPEADSIVSVPDNGISENEITITEPSADEDTVSDITEETGDAVPNWKEIKGFLVDESGFICGYKDNSVADIGILVFPSVAECTGVRSQVFAGLEDLCVEIFIPANMINIEAGAFEELSNLIYIEVDPDNPVYYSDCGVLYTRDGDLVCFPGGR